MEASTKKDGSFYTSINSQSHGRKDFLYTNGRHCSVKCVRIKPFENYLFSREYHFRIIKKRNIFIVELSILPLKSSIPDMKNQFNSRFNHFKGYHFKYVPDACLPTLQLLTFL
ncbi:hypothetical protein AMTRI_Chr11g158780 [Amborella trichopoda]